MRRLQFVTVLLVVASLPATSQFKEKVETRTSVSESLVRSNTDGFLFGWFDPARFSMHHTYSLSYMSAGGQGLSMGVYTNSMFYKISDPLDVQFDVSLMHSPYSSFGNARNLSGIYLSRAQLNYRPSENTLLQIQFRQLPSMYWWGANRSSTFFEDFGR